MHYLHHILWRRVGNANIVIKNDINQLLDHT